MPDLSGEAQRSRFQAFYTDVYTPEHQDPRNIVLHVFGTLLANLLAVLALLAPWPWPLAVLAWPIVHAAPGLIGHRLFERNAAIGDLRVTRSDAPKLWFILANHVLTWSVLKRGWESLRREGA